MDDGRARDTRKTCWITRNNNQEEDKDDVDKEWGGAILTDRIPFSNHLSHSLVWLAVG